MSSASPTPAAERMRRHRERRREGLRCLWVELHETELDALVRADCSSRSRATMRTRSPTRSMHISSAPWAAAVTRNRLTVEELAKDTLDVRELNRAGLLTDDWITLRPSLRWPRTGPVPDFAACVPAGLCGRKASMKAMKAKHPGGRPTSYRPEFCQRVVALMAEGRSLEGCAALLGVHPDSLNEWQKVHPGFSVAVRAGRAAATTYWENRLLGRGEWRSWQRPGHPVGAQEPVAGCERMAS